MPVSTNLLDARNYYTATCRYDLPLPRLTQDLDADVVVIGGGFSGINTALELAERGITNIVVIEARHLGYGGSGRNGGQVMAGIGHDINSVRRHVGPEGLETLFRISNLGAGIIRDRVARYGIDADLRRGYAYLAFNRRQAETLRKWEQEFREVAPDEDIALLTGRDVHQVVGSDVYQSALKHMGGGHVHSLNLLLGEAQALLSHGARIYENSPVIEVSYGNRITVRTNSGSVRAAKLLWACDSFLNGLEPEIHGRTIPTYSFQVATEPLAEELVRRISPIRGAYSDIRPIIDLYDPGLVKVALNGSFC
jgi:gamma-glutamylputrescine oxidase